MNLTLNELTVLATLLGGEKYGLEIIETVKEESNLKLYLGSLYNVLGRLEKKGLVESQWGEVTEDRKENRRRYYKLTGLGARVVREQLTSLYRIAQPKLGLGFA